MKDKQFGGEHGLWGGIYPVTKPVHRVIGFKFERKCAHHGDDCHAGRNWFLSGGFRGWYAAGIGWASTRPCRLTAQWNLVNAEARAAVALERTADLLDKLNSRAAVLEDRAIHVHILDETIDAVELARERERFAYRCEGGVSHRGVTQ